MAVKERAAEVDEDDFVNGQWVTIGGERMKMYVVDDGPTTHKDYLRFLEFQERRKNDSQRKKI